MKQYICIKMVQAEPCEAWKDAGNHKVGDPGYKVVYPDGYVSWSPKDVFEKAYLSVETNPMLCTDKPSISQQMVEDFIVGYDVQTMGEKCTVVRATLRNGFEIVESSACVSKENYDEALGAKICMKKVEDKVWFLLGFLLQTGVHGLDLRENSYADKAKETENDSMDFGAAIRAVKQGKKIARKGWNGKNQYVELASNIGYVAPDGAIVNPSHEAIGNKALAFCGTSGVQLGWLASQADMLADDWRVVE